MSTGFQGTAPGLPQLGAAVGPGWGGERVRWASLLGWTLPTFCVPGREPWGPLHPWGAPTCSPRSTSCSSRGRGYRSSVQAALDL